MISVRDLTLSVAQRRLLEPASFDIPAGEFVAVLGANGVGKTTLLRTIAGLRPMTHGTVTIDSRPVQMLAPDERGRVLAFVTGDDVFTEGLSVRDAVAAGRYPHHRWWQWRELSSDEEAIARALEAVDLKAFREREFATLSSGERQRAWIALALAQEAPVLLLDEPTSHLDLRAAQQILALLRDQADEGKTIVSVLHDPNEAAAYADRVLLLEPGAMLAYDSSAAALSPELLERAYGLPMETVRTASGALRVLAR